MPTLRVVPEPAEEPDAVALAGSAPHLDHSTGEATPLQWFPCVDPAVGAAVRAHVLMALNAWAVDTDVIADAMVLVSELVTNVRDHTASESLGVRVRVTRDRIVVAVVEQAASVAPPEFRLDHASFDVPQRDRGRGLRILDSLATEWGFVRSDGATTTWFAMPAESPVLPGNEPEIRRF